MVIRLRRRGPRWTAWVVLAFLVGAFVPPLAAQGGPFSAQILRALRAFGVTAVGTFRLADGTAAAPAVAFTTEPTLGISRFAANRVDFSGAGTIGSVNPILTIRNTADGSWTLLDTFGALGFASDDTSSGGTAGKIRAQISGYEDDTFGASQGLAFWTTNIANGTLIKHVTIDSRGRLYVGIGTNGLLGTPILTVEANNGGGTTPDGFLLTNPTNGGWAPPIVFSARTSDNTQTAIHGQIRTERITDSGHAPTTKMVFGTTNAALVTTDWWSLMNNGAWVGSAGTTITVPLLTAGAATGLTVAETGSLRTQVYKVTVATSAFVCNAVTCDLTIGTLPANTWLTNATAQLTTTFACTAVCTTSTLSMVLGKGAGAAEYLASFDADAATGYFGDADAEMGTLLARAAAIQGGTVTTTSQAVVLRLTSGTGNVGNGAATNLSQGALTVWITTTTLP